VVAAFGSTWAARRAYRGNIEAAERNAAVVIRAADPAAQAARAASELNVASAGPIAEMTKETQRSIEPDRDRRAWRRHFLEPFMEHAIGRFR
jgi:hypothetical protein